jgi:hypothetical protein
VVQDVIPPEPSKLVDQARRVLDVAEDLPPVEIVPDVIDLRRLIGDEPEILLPCMGAWDELPREGISYLDQRPEWRDWTLIGCARSQQIHRWFYGQPTPMRDFCPRARPPSDDLVLTRCCLIEEGIEVRDRTVFVPWGADLATVKEGLVRAVSLGCDRQRVDTAGEPASP